MASLEVSSRLPAGISIVLVANQIKKVTAMYNNIDNY